MTGVSNPTTDSARLVLAEAKKAFADDSLTEQGLRDILQTVKDAIASLESIRKASQQLRMEDKQRAKKQQEKMSLQIKLKKLAKELSKLLKDSNLETVDKDVLENSQKELQKAVLFLADEKGSEHTEAEVIDNLKEVIAKLKANA
ncbi:surface anchored protein [Streptococcus pneumoniae]|nr:surface anchored protein [Streptococcus pneumoniae]